MDGVAAAPLTITFSLTLFPSLSFPPAPQTLPTFQLYSGALGRVAQFTASLNSASLERLRTMLRVHSFQRTSFVPGQRGPASVFHADGWPAIVRPVPGSVSGSGADAAGRP